MSAPVEQPPKWATLLAHTIDPTTGEEAAVEIEVRAPVTIPPENVLRCIADATGAEALAAIWNAAVPGEEVSVERMSLFMAQWSLARGQGVAVNDAS